MDARPPPSDSPGNDRTSLGRFEPNFASLSAQEYAQFVEAALPGILALLRAHYGHRLGDAELREVSQQVFAVSWVKRDRFSLNQEEGRQGEGQDPVGASDEPTRKRSLWGWLWGIAGNLAIDTLRSRSSSPAQLAESYDPPAPEASDDRDAEQRPLTPREVAVRGFIEALSWKDRRIVEGATSGIRSWTISMASELNMRPGAVRLRWLRIRRRLAEALKSDGDGHE